MRKNIKLALSVVLVIAVVCIAAALIRDPAERGEQTSGSHIAGNTDNGAENAGEETVLTGAILSPVFDSPSSGISAEPPGNDETAEESYCSKLPVIYIDTENNAEVNSKENAVAAVIRTQGNSEYDGGFTASCQVKGRGNTSWGFPQKPYIIKLNKAAGLFGLRKTKNWLLLSNYLDESLIRSKIVEDIAKSVEFPVNDYICVVLILNGEYQGVYQLTEQMQSTDGRYLFELSTEYDEPIKFKTAISSYPIMLNSPEVPEDSYLIESWEKLWNEWDEAIHSKSGYSSNGTYYAELMDMESAVDYYLLQDLIANNDGMKNSRFAYLDDNSKIVFGPIWDVDVCLNPTGKTLTAWKWTSDIGDFNDPSGWKMKNSTHEGNFFNALMTHEDFAALAKERWETIFEPAVGAYLASGKIESYKEYLYEEGIKHSSMFHFDRGFEVDFDNVSDYLRARYEWLCSEYGKQ